MEYRDSPEASRGERVSGAAGHGEAGRAEESAGEGDEDGGHHEGDLRLRLLRHHPLLPVLPAERPPVLLLHGEHEEHVPGKLRKGISSSASYNRRKGIEYRH